MALIKCHECQKEVSTEAKTCPNCGAKVIAPKVKRKTSPYTIALVVVIIAVSIAANLMHKQDSPSQDRTKWEPPKEELAKQGARKAAIDKWGNAGVYKSIKSCTTEKMMGMSFPGYCVEVRPEFYALDFDTKKSIVEVIWVYYAVQDKTKMRSLDLIDAKSGKRVGHYENGTLRLD